RMPISEEYCTFCGRSSRYSSVTMKRCINCDSLSGDDSLFCAACGSQEFRDAVVDHIPETKKSIPEKEIDKSVDTATDNFKTVLAKAETKKKLILIIISGIAAAGIILG